MRPNVRLGQSRILSGRQRWPSWAVLRARNQTCGVARRPWVPACRLHEGRCTHTCPASRAVVSQVFCHRCGPQRLRQPPGGEQVLCCSLGAEPAEPPLAKSGGEAGQGLRFKERAEQASPQDSVPLRGVSEWGSVGARQEPWCQRQGGS